jgi:glutamate formiminotransferase
MTWLVIPNVSEGRDQARITAMKASIERAGADTLDIHSDAAHDRSVFTVTGDEDEIVSGMTDLASSCEYIDLTHHTGVHPRLGRVDVCPIVALDEPERAAIALARAVGAGINTATGLPIYFYGTAATRPDTRDLPRIRRGGLPVLKRRALDDLPPDLGRPDIDPRAGVVCVGVRGVLIAFNVWLQCPVSTARAIAGRIRSSGGGRQGIRALGLAIDDAPTSQVSMNLIQPTVTGIDAAFEAVAQEAARFHAPVVATEIVGLVPERFLPAPNAQAARLLLRPGRSVESALS